MKYSLRDPDRKRDLGLTLERKKKKKKGQIHFVTVVVLRAGLSLTGQSILSNHPSFRLHF